MQAVTCNEGCLLTHCKTMAKDTPERFAKLVLAELADLKALVMGINDYVIGDMANQGNLSLEAIKQPMEKKRAAMRKKILSRLQDLADLPGPRIQ